jgi:hypothetical protein
MEMVRLRLRDAISALQLAISSLNLWEKSLPCEVFWWYH